MEKITGTSAVNAKNEVLIFVDVPVIDFLDFVLIDNRIILIAENDDRYDKTYGELTCETVGKTGVISVVQLDDVGKPVAMKRLEVRRGL